MTPIQVLRMMINDEDQKDKLFEDTELEYILNKYSSHYIRTFTPQNNEIVLDDYVFINSIVGVDSNNVEKTLVLNTDYTFLVKYKIIKLIGDYVTVKVDGIRYDFREASADCLEMIANNFRRLNQFSVMNNSQNLDDTKRFLLDAASRLRKVRGLR